MEKIIKLFTTSLLGMILSILGTQSFASTEVARINDKAITLDELNKTYENFSKTPPYVVPSKKAVLDGLVKRELGIQEAKKLGLHQDPQVLERMNTVLYQALLEKKLSPEFERIQITDDQAKAYYKRNPELRTSQIFVKLAPNASAEEQKKTYEQIKKIETDILKPSEMSFAEAAQKFSEDPFARTSGGDLGFLPPERMEPTYYQAALKLSQGKTSGIVKTSMGYHIIQLTGIRSWDETNHSRVKQMAFEEQRAKLFDKYMSNLKAQARVNTHFEMLKD